jgi:glycosyltransferase involved in cell wall biosynthesis
MDQEALLRLKSSVVPGTPLYDLLVRVQTPPEGEFDRFVRVDASSVEGSAGQGGTAHSAFLSVLMRTQGKRHETMQESLLALAAQTSQDFEVLILAHDVSDDVLGALHELACSFGEEFSARIKIHSVVGGGRSRPLNVGVEEAQGRYLALLDDDDIVFGNWVEVFERSAAVAPGRIIRCVPSEQDVRPTEWPDGRHGYEITSRPRCPWPVKFDLLDHLFENRTPPCSYALPRSAFSELGIRFDEELPVLEDWEVLLRVAMLTGVFDTGVVTALWRKWEDGDSSTFVHSHSDWRRARLAVTAKLDGGPLLLPEGSMRRIQELVAAQDRARRIKTSIIWRLKFPVRTARRMRRRYLSRIR